MTQFEKLTDSISEYIVGDWNITEGGVYRDSNSKRFVASPIPIVPTAIMDNIDTDIEKVELSFIKHNRLRSIIVPRSKIANRSKIVELADLGVEVSTTSSKDLVDYLSFVISNNLDVIPHKRSKSVLGWSDDDFVPFAPDIAFDGDEQFKHLYAAVRQKGELSDWVREIAPLRNNTEMRLTMAASFASPIIEMIGENPFVLHLWGGTGSGKTVALLVAMSVWGNPAMGKMTRTMNMTANSMMSTASFLNSIPFAGDELQTIKDRWKTYDNLIMQITEGVDRGRMTYDKVNEMRSWKCSFIFTGEEPCTKASSGGGAKNRVIEIECKGKLVENGNQVANFVRSNYGCPAAPYIAELVKTKELISAQYNVLFNAIINSYDTTDKQAGALAILLLADGISSRLFWPNDGYLTIEDAARYLKSNTDVDIAERAYEWVTSWISENYRLFENSDSAKAWGVEGESDDGVRVMFINKAVLIREMTAAGFDFDAVKRKWVQQGRLKQSADRGRTRFYRRINGNRTDCICLVREQSDEDVPTDTH